MSQDISIKDGARSQSRRTANLPKNVFGLCATSQDDFDPAAQSRHARMLDAIQDCDVLLARGMGAGAYESIRQAGIKPVLTDVETIDLAVQQYLAGILEDHIEKLH